MEFKWRLSVNKWSDVKCSDVEWSDVIYVKWSEMKWSEVSYGEVLGDKSAMYIRVTLYWGVVECIVTISFGVCLVLWLF